MSFLNNSEARPTGNKAAKLEQHVKVLSNSSISLAESGRILSEAAINKAKDNKDRTVVLNRLVDLDILWI